MIEHCTHTRIIKKKSLKHQHKINRQLFIFKQKSFQFRTQTITLQKNEKFFCFFFTLYKKTFQLLTSSSKTYHRLAESEKKEILLTIQ